MANVYYKIDGDNCYYTNENKSGYTLRSPTNYISREKIVIIELYNDKFILPENSSHLFQTCNNITFNDMNKWDTSEVINMDLMFYSCGSLTTLDLSSWDTSNVTSMNAMFYNCRSLTFLNISNFDVSNVISIDHIFYDCKKLEQILIKPNTNWEIEATKLTEPWGLFDGCTKLPNWDGAIDISRANNTTPTGYFGIAHPWTKYQVYIRRA